jgi:hypothetical protein
MSPMVTSFDFSLTGAAQLRAVGGALPARAISALHSSGLAGLLTLLLISP